MTKPIPSQDLFTELSSQKLLVFFEKEPCTDRFRQVVFTADQQKRLLRFIYNQLLLRRDDGTPVIITAEGTTLEFANAMASFPDEEVDEYMTTQAEPSQL